MPGTTMPRYNRIHVIVNPAAGQDYPILHTLNRVFAPEGVDWAVSVTTGPGDATAAAQRALRDNNVDLIVVYGGDGTVMEVANALLGHTVPMAILRGGTSNVLATELGIPHRIETAAELIFAPSVTVRAVDMGLIAGKHFFHLGIGLEGEIIRATERNAKERSGILAYFMAGLRQLRQPRTAHYRLQLDGETIEAEGVNCMITNIGSAGFAGLRLLHKIDISDGLMDVLLIRAIDLPALMNAATGALTSGEVAGPVKHWQAREVHISVDPPQPAALDGEPQPAQPTFETRIVPQAVRILVPGKHAED